MPGLGGAQVGGPQAAGQAGGAAGLRPDEQLLLTDAAGGVLETDRANVFAVADGVLRTPAADGRILPGVMRARVLAAAREAGVAVGTGPLALSELLAASEVFVTNAMRGLLPVLGADGRPDGWRPGPVRIRLAAALPAGGRAIKIKTRTGNGAAPARCRRAARGRRGGTPVDLVLVIDNYDSFTYNLVHLLRAARRAGQRWCATTR